MYRPRAAGSPAAAPAHVGKESTGTAGRQESQSKEWIEISKIILRALFILIKCSVIKYLKNSSYLVVRGRSMRGHVQRIVRRSLRPAHKANDPGWVAAVARAALDKRRHAECRVVSTAHTHTAYITSGVASTTTAQMDRGSAVEQDDDSIHPVPQGISFFLLSFSPS